MNIFGSTNILIDFLHSYNTNTLKILVYNIQQQLFKFLYRN